MKLYQGTNKGTDEGHFLFLCPGCDGPHGLRIGSNGWLWNGDREKPTLEPSIKVTNSTGLVCHSFIRDGRIQFLDDCTHGLKGQTVDLPEWDRKWDGPTH